MDSHFTVYRLRIHRTVPGVDLEVGAFRHVNLDTNSATVISPIEAPMAVDAGIDLNAVALLPGIDVEVLVDLVAVVEDAEIDLFSVARVDLDGAVIGVHADLSAA